MPEPARNSPDYATPPVIETILGVQFDLLDDFTNAHLGAFWQSVREHGWTTASDAPALEPQIERFGPAGWARAGVRMKFTQDFSSRLQIKHEQLDRMLQVQNGRLHFNWLGEAGLGYPRYPEVREGFVELFRRFAQFLDNEGFPQPRPNQWEVTYVNHIPRGTVWNSPADWSFFLPLNSMPTFEGLIEAESFAGEWHFVLPNERGRLHVQWQHALKSKEEPDAQEFIRLTSTARGSFKNNNAEIPNILEGLDFGHDAIVCSFAKCMSKSANNYWGLKNAADLS